MIFKHGKEHDVPYDDWQGWPDTNELQVCFKTAEKSQVEKVWRRKTEGTPPPTNMNQSMPPPGRIPQQIGAQSIEKYQPIETEYK
jgi:hypothetical protein